jgi:hypothetical protein
MGPGLQNTPEGVRLALRQGADIVELDVVKIPDGRFLCVHGSGRGAMLTDCLAEASPDMEVMLHLKGRFEVSDLVRLFEAIEMKMPLDRVLFAAHRTRVLRQVRELLPRGRVARFGLFPTLKSLWRQQPWQCCMINQVVLPRWLVLALQRKGYLVFASCVWEVRSRTAVRGLGVDGAFVNLYR